MQITKKNLLIFVGIFYLLLYIILKMFIVFTQDLFMNHEVYQKTYNPGDVMTIHTNVGENTDFFITKSKKYPVQVKNYFNDFVLDEEDDNYESYALFGDNNLVKAVFMVGVYDTQLTNIESYSEDSYYYEFNHFPLYISDILRKHFLKKYQINDDIDLIKYIRERKKIQCNFFTPITKIKENYFFNFIELALPSLDNITYIEGDLEGYMFKGDNYKRAFILKNDKLYCFTFHKLDYFSDDMIQDILENIIIS